MGGGIFGSMADWAVSLSTMLSDLIDPRFWMRVGEGLLGIVLVGAGFWLLVRHEVPSPSKVAGAVGKVAEVA